MNKVAKTFLGAGLLVICLPVLAAKPVSIKYREEIVVDDSRTYTHYIVKCTDGKELDMSSWDSGKRWCVGKGLENECSKKQIRIAKKLCK